MKNWIEFLGGRSFILCVGCAGVCSFLLWHGKLQDGSYLAIILGTVGAYVVKAAVQNRSEIRADVEKTIAGVGSPDTITQGS